MEESDQFLNIFSINGSSWRSHKKLLKEAERVFLMFIRIEHRLVGEQYDRAGHRLNKQVRKVKAADVNIANEAVPVSWCDRLR